MSIIERERIQLEVQLEEEEEEENHPEKCFIDQAMALLKEREQTISTELNVSANENIFEEHLLDDESIETGAGSGFKNSKYFYFYQGKSFFSKILSNSAY